ncbi:hypothetical protein L1887_14480 [Cichorium endivia]|nr:hypothetical protein L1887_14480 [Cichorium endivia]
MNGRLQLSDVPISNGVVFKPLYLLRRMIVAPSKPLPRIISSFYGQSFRSALTFLSKFKGVKSLRIVLSCSSNRGFNNRSFVQVEGQVRLTTNDEEEHGADHLVLIEALTNDLQSKARSANVRDKYTMCTNLVVVIHPKAKKDVVMDITNSEENCANGDRKLMRVKKIMNIRGPPHKNTITAPEVLHISMTEDDLIWNMYDTVMGINWLGIKILNIEPYDEDERTGYLRYVQMAVTTYNTSLPASERYRSRVQVSLVWNSRSETSASSERHF